MRVAILAVGTRGDVQPMLAVSDELMRRGHEVRLAVNDDLAEWAGRTGVDVVPNGLDVRGFLHSDEARRFLATGKVATTMRRIAADDRRANESIVAACVDVSKDADIVLTTMMMGLRGMCVERATGVPSRTLFYCPFPSTRRWASMMTGVRDFRLPSLNRASWQLFHTMLWRQNRTSVDEMCATLGVAPYRRRPRLEDRPSLHLYSPHVVPTPDDWSSCHEVVGWTTLSPGSRELLGENALPDELADWLDAGEPPVYFGFGSMPVLDPDGLVESLANTTAERGVRGLVTAGWSDYGRLRSRLPGHLFLATGELDHDRLLPRCRAAVHHGGAGTTAAVLRAGLPSVVLSVFWDQPYWGWRLEQHAAGVTFPFRRLTPGRLGAALDRILTEDYRHNAAALSRAVRTEDGTRAAVDAVERWTA